MSVDDGLGSDATDGDHGEAAVHELRNLLGLHALFVLGAELGEAEVTSIALSLVGGNHSRALDAKVEEPDPEEELVHGAGLEENIMCIDGLGDGIEGVHLAGKTDVVGGDKAQDSHHCRAAVADLALAEPRDEGRVALGKIQGVVLEFLAAEVDGANIIVEDGVDGDGGGAAGVSRGEGGSGADEGSEDGGLHGY